VFHFYFQENLLRLEPLRHSPQPYARTARSAWVKENSRRRKTIWPRVADSYFRLASCKEARKNKVTDWRT
jgi:hypothetical protein